MPPDRPIESGSITGTGDRYMKKIVVVLAGVVSSAGCSEAKKDATASSAAGESAAASKPADGMTGVAECDDYLNKVMAC
ncbi:hypothetical protein OY671_007893, partial [Metschnikowia pulcherrima]